MKTMRIFMNETILVLVLAMISASGNASIKMPAIFQSNMVLQRDKTVQFWGFGKAGEKVTVGFKGHNYKTKTGKDNNWSVQLPAQVAGGPYEITIKGDTNIIELKNILFGDVWVCGGQSNMQISLDYIGQVPADSLAKDSKLRIFTTPVDMDYVPKNDLAGGTWKEASAETVRYFSATAYFFGKFLRDSIDVPIGLVSDNLGATSVETWMSKEALWKFPQFSTYYKDYLAPAKSFKEVTAAFEKTRPEWEKNYYLKGRGMKQKWYLPETSTTDWKTMEIPAWWEDKGMADFDGAVWFRKSFDLPENFKGNAFYLPLNQIDDYDIVWVNGTKVGEGFGNMNWRNYSVPVNILKSTGNVIVVRVFDAGGKGGMYSGAIWGNPIILGSWLYKADDKIDAAAFPRPHVVNVSPFSTPAVLYNANIAPITQLRIKGFIWYQGEGNASRASEYRDLFPVFIHDWRMHFNQGDLPFLFVQLANYMHEDSSPQESEWAELRDAQAAALKLPNTGMAVTIDIGEANDIHPKNKMDVGRRLGLSALRVAYNKRLVSTGPVFESMELAGNAVIVHYAKGTGNLITKDKYGYVSGFAVAGGDNKFRWAKAYIRNDRVIVHCDSIAKPVSIRYAWSDNPGTTDLYSSEGLPAVPFRTDSLPLKTAGKLFSENHWEN